MKPFALTNSAKADLKAIAAFTEKHWGKEQRNLYVKQLDDAFHFLAATPSAGKSCDYIRSGDRLIPQGSHLVFYKTGVVSKVEVVRILHKSMDVGSKFDDP